MNPKPDLSLGKTTSILSPPISRPLMSFPRLFSMTSCVQPYVLDIVWAFRSIAKRQSWLDVESSKPVVTRDRKFTEVEVFMNDTVARAVQGFVLPSSSQVHTTSIPFIIFRLFLFFIHVRHQADRRSSDSSCETKPTLVRPHFHNHA